jgi:hypothetical protein
MPFLASPLKRRALPALLLAAPALAQDWPSRPIRLIVPFTPGGPVDVVARLLAERLRDLLGQPVLIENRAGAGGSLGVRQVATSPPDGTALVLTSSSLAIWPAMHPQGGLDPRQDLTPISLVADIATTIVARPGGPLGDLSALLRAARAEAGAIIMWWHCEFAIGDIKRAVALKLGFFKALLQSRWQYLEEHGIGEQELGIKCDRIGGVLVGCSKWHGTIGGHGSNVCVHVIEFKTHVVDLY